MRVRNIITAFLCIIHVLNHYWVWRMISGVFGRLFLQKKGTDNSKIVHYKVE